MPLTKQNGRPKSVEYLADKLLSDNNSSSPIFIKMDTAKKQSATSAWVSKYFEVVIISLP